MAQVKFYGMSLDFDIVKRLYKLPTDNFDALIFQLEIENPNKWNDKYALVAYPVDKAGIVTSGETKIKLVQDDEKPHDVSNKLLFSNLPLSRAQIKIFIDAESEESLIKTLYFAPYKYEVESGTAEYVAYKVTKRDSSFTFMPLLTTNIKPSPPAPPPA